MTAGTASLKVTNVPVSDYGAIPNSLMRGKFTPATASLEVTWTGVGKTVKLRDDAVGWGGDFMSAKATCAFSAQTQGFSYTTDPASTATSLYAIMGRERNGSYFHDTLRLGDG